MTNTTPPVVLPGDVTTPAGVAKLLTYLALAAVSILIPALADDQLSTLEIINAAIVALGAFVVYEVKVAKGLKTIATFALAGLQALVLVIADGSNLADVSIANWLAVVVAGLAAIGVAFVPNKPAITPGLDGAYNITVVSPATIPVDESGTASTRQKYPSE